MQNDPESDFEDAAEFFRRGDDGDYAEAESLPAGSIAFAENDDQSDPTGPTDPKLLERQLARRARYTRCVKLGMSALSLVTVVALFTRALQPSPGDSPNTDDSHALISDASPPRHAALAPGKGLETPSLERSRAAPPAQDLPAQMPSAPLVRSSAVSPGGAIIEPAVRSKMGSSAVRSQPLAATAGAAPRAAKVATAGARGAARQALASNRVAKPLSRSSLPSLATIQAQGASRPPTARFAD